MAAFISYDNACADCFHIPAKVHGHAYSMVKLYSPPFNKSRGHFGRKRKATELTSSLRSGIFLDLIISNERVMA